MKTKKEARNVRESYLVEELSKQELVKIYGGKVTWKIVNGKIVIVIE